MDKLKIACVGDVMCGDQFNHIGWGAASQIERYGDDFVDPAIVSILKSHDITLCNIECVLSDVGRSDDSVRSLHMRGRPGMAKKLVQWGISVANLSNNHILEHGIGAAEDTVQLLLSHGIKTIGTGANGSFGGRPEWTQMTIREHRLAMIGFCLRDEKYAYYYQGQLAELCQQVLQRKKDGQTVLVSIHWGDELIDRPNQVQRQWASQLLDAGATLIAGHHAHVVQGIYQKSGRLAIYGLGNFIFDSWCRRTSWSVILSVTIECGKICDYQIIPIERGKDFRPILPGSARSKELMSEFKRRTELSQSLPEEMKSYMKKYNDELKLINGKDRISLWLRIASSFWKCKPKYWYGILLRPIQRRSGNW